MPETRQGRDLTLVACRPADPAGGYARKTNKIHFPPAVNYFDSGFVAGIPRGGVYDHEVVPILQNVTVLCPDSGSIPSH